MPWFKVDDKLHDHKKARRARKAAMGVWVLAGSWSGGNLTDGFIPDDVATRWGTSRDFAALVSAELWEVASKGSEDGWQFVNWDEFQPLKSEIEAERQRKVDAGRKGGKASGRSRREADTQAGAQAGASSLVPELLNPRPDPTRPDPKEAKASSPTAIAKAIPERFEEFWTTYDKKRGRKNAINKYRLALKKRGVTPELLLEAATSYIAWQRSEGKHPEFTKDPATWLNGEHWTDERPKAVAIRPRPTAAQIEQPPDGLTDAEYAQWVSRRRLA